MAQPDSPAALQHPEHDGLAREGVRPALALALGLLAALASVHLARFATDPRLVDFHRLPFADLKRARLHCEPDTVQHEPRRLLSDLEVARQFVAADPVLV